MLAALPCLSVGRPHGPVHAGHRDRQRVVDPARRELGAADDPGEVAEPRGDAARAEAVAFDLSAPAPADLEHAVGLRVDGPEVVLPARGLVDDGHVGVVVPVAFVGAAPGAALEAGESAFGNRPVRNVDLHPRDITSAAERLALDPVGRVGGAGPEGGARASVGIAGDEGADAAAAVQGVDDGLRVRLDLRMGADPGVERARGRVGPPVGARPVAGAEAPRAHAPSALAAFGAERAIRLCCTLLKASVYVLLIGLFIFLLNIPFFFIGYKQIGKTFALSTVLGITFLSIFTYFLHPVARFTDDLLLATVFGGIVLGIGVGLVIRYGGSLDGTEILSLFFLVASRLFL